MGLRLTPAGETGVTTGGHLEIRQRPLVALQILGPGNTKLRLTRPMSQGLTAWGSSTHVTSVQEAHVVRPGAFF